MPDDAKSMRYPNILQRLNAVMEQVKFVQKEKKQGMRYSIVSHDSVTKLVRPKMVENGIVYWPIDFVIEQVGNRTQLSCKVVFASIHDPADRIEVSTAGFGIDDQDKGPGKAISYAVKYALLKALGLESGDDPDEEQDAMLKPSILDPDRATVDDFKDAVAMADSMEKLEQLRADIKPVLDKLRADYAAYVQEATTKWQQKAATLKKAAAPATEPA
jgi:hypothetical protein